MNKQYQLHGIPRSRIASFDVYNVARSKNHVAALLEFDVTESRRKIRKLRRNGEKISFNAWLVKVVGDTLLLHPAVSSYLFSKRKQITFKDINIALVVEKELNGERVPIPMVIEKVDGKDVSVISLEIEEAKKSILSEKDIVLKRKTGILENLYYSFPGFLRRYVWKYMLGHPKMAFRKMGNVSITSLGMLGRINGWFIHRSVHPVSFGIGSVMQKPWVINEEVQIREILNMTVLMDHDVIDGAPMLRFVRDLAAGIEKGEGLITEMITGESLPE